MITFKTFLDEAKHRVDVPLERAEEIAKEKCTDALDHLGAPLVRGFSAKGEAYMVKGEFGGRSSANTSNHYTVTMDELFVEQGYPARQKSVIFANFANVSHAADYGTLYAMLPFDGIAIGVCPEMDVWDTEVRLGSKIWTFEKWNEMLEGYGVLDYSFEDQVNYIEEVLADFEDDNNDGLSRYFSPGKVEAQLRAAFDPKQLGFRLMTPKTVYSIPNARELWASDSILAIRFDVFEKLREKWENEANGA